MAVSRAILSDDNRVRDRLLTNGTPTTSTTTATRTNVMPLQSNRRHDLLLSMTCKTSKDDLGRAISSFRAAQKSVRLDSATKRRRHARLHKRHESSYIGQESRLRAAEFTPRHHEVGATEPKQATISPNDADKNTEPNKRITTEMVSAGCAPSDCLKMSEPVQTSSTR